MLELVLAFQLALSLVRELELELELKHVSGHCASAYLPKEFRKREAINFELPWIQRQKAEVFLHVEVKNVHKPTTDNLARGHKLKTTSHTHSQHLILIKLSKIGVKHGLTPFSAGNCEKLALKRFLHLSCTMATKFSTAVDFKLMPISTNQ